MSGLIRPKHSRLSLLAGILMLSLLPLTSFADTSAIAYSPYAPEISIWPERQPVSSEEIARAPHDSVFISFTSPWLTDMELAKMREFQAALKDGEIDYVGSSVVNPSTVSSQDVAVFTLDPDVFLGETYYVFLPDSSSLSDTQLVALAAAFEELGIDFDPDSLNDRNCCRHCNVLETRCLTDEENDRMEAIRSKVRHGQLKKEDIPAGTQILAVEKRTERGWGLDSRTFLFYPYRRITDDEMALFALADEGEWDTDPDELQAAALKDAGNLINLPETISKYDSCTNRELMQISGDTYLPRSSPVYKYTSQFYFEGYNGFNNQAHCNMDIVQLQETGSVPETAGIHLRYAQYSTFSDDDSPESHEAEWLAAVKDWAGQTLRLQEDVLQSGWIIADRTTDYDGSQLIKARLITEKLEICVWIYQNSCQITDCLIYNRKWYDDSDKGFYL